MAAPAICRPGFQAPSSILPLPRKSLAGREGSRSSKNISTGKCSEGTSRKSAARDLNPASGGRRMGYRRSLSDHGRRSVGGRWFPPYPYFCAGLAVQIVQPAAAHPVLRSRSGARRVGRVPRIAPEGPVEWPIATAAAKNSPPHQKFAAVISSIILISGDLPFGEPSAQDPVPCCNPSPDNSRDTWTC